MISIVCVFNDWEVLERFLLRSLDTQTAPYEMHLVDNTNGRFKSAAEALNFGGQQATGKYIMFVHQDVYLASAVWLESVENTLDTLPKLGIAGVAGKTKNGMHTYSNAEHAPIPRLSCHFQVSSPMKVLTLDELVLIIPKAQFRYSQFNPELCPDWHLYGVEYCLRLNRQRYNSYVLSQPVYHWGGRQVYKILPQGYFDTLKILLPQYRDFKIIPTTSDDWSTRIPLSWQSWRIWGIVWKLNNLRKSKTKIVDVSRGVFSHFLTLGAVQRLAKEVLTGKGLGNVLSYVDHNRYDALRGKYGPTDRLTTNKLTCTEINEHLTTIQMLTQQLGLKHVLELGVLEGRSTLAFLSAVKEMGGHVTSIDIEDCPEARQAVMDEGLAPFWAFIEQDDMTAGWDQPIDHLFIDTSHAYHHTLAELTKYEPFVRAGGLITLHDTISFPGVQRAIDDYLLGKPHLRQYSYFNNNGLGVIFKGE